MIGPRDSVVRTLLGEDVPLDELLRDESPFIDTNRMPWYELPELRVDLLHDYVEEA